MEEIKNTQTKRIGHIIYRSYFNLNHKYGKNSTTGEYRHIVATYFATTYVPSAAANRGRAPKR